MIFYFAPYLHLHFYAPNFAGPQWVSACVCVCVWIETTEISASQSIK